MTEAEKILKMIEAVDPDDTHAMDSINTAFWDWNGRSHKTNMFWDVSRSRDALKAERPEGWWVFDVTEECGSGWQWEYVLRNRTNHNSVEGIGNTEELAELHAMVQARQWEKENGK